MLKAVVKRTWPSDPMFFISAARKTARHTDVPQRRSSAVTKEVFDKEAPSVNDMCCKSMMALL